VVVEAAATASGLWGLQWPAQPGAGDDREHEQEQGRKSRLSDEAEDALVCFLQTLTDGFNSAEQK
jgi:hypothetical protein